MFLSMVYGFPGESEQSMDENSEWIKFVVREFGEAIQTLHISPLMITTGSRAYYDLMGVDSVRKKYEEKPVPYDTIEMSEDYFELFCKMPRQAVIAKIRELFDAVGIIQPRGRLSYHLHHKDLGKDMKGVEKEK